MGFSPESHQIVALDAGRTTAGADLVGDWIRPDTFADVDVIVLMNSFAAQDVTLTLNQATDNSGSGSKALNIKAVWRKRAADITTVGTFTRVDPTTDNTYVMDGDFEELVVLDVDVAELDRANGFNWISCTVSGTGSPRIYAAHYVLSGPRYAQSVQLSVI